ncbi:hypothetical protein ACFV4M_33025, partial [Kitasatospora indigofera]|uniref:hypothetical protein n=1 Tax=Kitasatospora indigofera TaxID=67307 RepID=UPI003661327E
MLVSLGCALGRVVRVVLREAGRDCGRTPCRRRATGGTHHGGRLTAPGEAHEGARPDGPAVRVARLARATAADGA